MDNLVITALLIAFLSVGSGMGAGFFVGLINGHETREKRLLTIVVTVFTMLGAMMASMWLVTAGSIQ